MTSNTLLQQQAKILAGYPPFDALPADAIELLLSHAQECYFAPKEIIIQPQSGIVDYVLIIKQGTVSARNGLADGVEFVAGDMFLVNAASVSRAVTSTYEAQEDCFCWRIPYASIRKVADSNMALANYLANQTMHFLDLSHKAIQASYSQAALSEYSHLRKLGEVAHLHPFSCSASQPLQKVLQIMHDKAIGSMIVVDDNQHVEGIFTRKDILGKVTLPQLPLSQAVGEVMSRPVHTLSIDDSFEDAALLMARYGVRHVPIVDKENRLAGIVSERDLFAIQRLSLKKVVSNAAQADSIEQLQQVAQDIRVFARNMVSQGIQARALTEMISHLNDALTQRLLDLIATQHGLDLGLMCWLCFGSEGREEQTIATDQDNGLIFHVPEQCPPQDMEAIRSKWLSFARDVNEALDQCGYPLCKGNIMASNPECCLTLQEWCRRFDRWIERGTPEDLLAANIYFDIRPLAGAMHMAEQLQSYILAKVRGNTRFLKMLSVDVLRRKVPLNWRGALDAETLEDHGELEVIDLKSRGTAIFVDFARIQALAYGVSEVNTRKRMLAIAKIREIPDNYSHAWVTAFEYLQMLRLRVQIVDTPSSSPGANQQATATGPQKPAAGAVLGYPNHIVIDALNTIDRKLLKESFRMARKLQQRLELDYPH